MPNAKQKSAVKKSNPRRNFVPQEELHKYSDDEKVYDKDPLTGENRLRVYPKGTFIYRMAGRERENSASYYTPEVLTKCEVSESLDVLVKQQLEPLATDKEKAERILSWKICENCTTSLIRIQAA